MAYSYRFIAITKNIMLLLLYFLLVMLLYSYNEVATIS